MRVGSAEAVQITKDKEDERAPVVSPDGRWIAFYSARSGRQDIWLVPSDGSAASKPLTQAATMSVERFRVDSTRVAANEFEGHQERQVFGVWEATSQQVDAGTLHVPVDQPLGRIECTLVDQVADLPGEVCLRFRVENVSPHCPGLIDLRAASIALRMSSNAVLPETPSLRSSRAMAASIAKRSLSGNVE